MKRILSIIPVAILCVLLAGCAPFLDTEGGPEPGNGLTRMPIKMPLFDFYANEPGVTAFAENFETDFPVSVTVQYSTVAGGEPVTVTDEQTIRAVFEALSNITVLDEAGGGHTDDELDYYFTMQDGSTVGFTFQEGMLMDDRMMCYNITGFGDLQKAFPWHSGNASVEAPYVNDTLGFELYLTPGWNPYDMGNDETSGTVRFIPDEFSFGTTDYFLSIGFEYGASREDAEQEMDSFTDTILKNLGGVETTIVREGDTQLDHVGAYSAEYETTMPDGARFTTFLYLVDGGDGSCYYISYTLPNGFHAFDDFVSAADSIVDTFTLIPRTLAAPAMPTPEETPEPVPETTAQPAGDKVDYMQFTGISTPDDIETLYGAPSEVEENTAEGMPYLLYHYRNASISFTPVDGVWLVDGVMNYRPDSPILVGGVSVGMDSYTAEETLVDHGYSYETTDAQGYMYYTFYDEREILCLVAVLVDENLVSEANGWYGPVAEGILATGGGA